jgi:membrane protease YdiL (CAAX protease family)
LAARARQIGGKSKTKMEQKNLRSKRSKRKNSIFVKSYNQMLDHQKNSNAYYPPSFWAKSLGHPLIVALFAIGTILLLKTTVDSLLKNFLEALTGFKLEYILNTETPKRWKTAYKLALALSQLLTFGLSALLFSKLSGNLRKEIGFETSTNISLISLGALLTLVAQPLILFIILDSDSFFLPEALKGLEAQLEEIEYAVRKKLVVLLDDNLGINLFVFALIPGVVEELFFRGFLQNTLLRFFSPHIAVWVTGLLFSLLHFQVFGFFSRWILGIFFGYMALWHKNLLPAIASHFANNAFHVSVAYYKIHNNILSAAEAENISSIDGIWALLSALGCTAIMIAFYKYARRFNTPTSVITHEY